MAKDADNDVSYIDVIDKRETHETELLLSASDTASMSTLELFSFFGCRINESDFEGLTPLIVAVKNDNKALVEYFCNKNADIDQPTRNGETPLYIACERINREIVELLLDAGSNVNAKTNRLHPQTGSSPLMVALPSTYEINVKGKKKSESFHIIKLLLSHNCDINAQNWAGNTALHISSDRNDLATISLLSENGANLHIRNNFGLTAFEEAIQPNIQRYDVAALLLLNGYDIEVVKPEVHPLISILKGINHDKSKYFLTSKFTRNKLLELLLNVVCLNAELEHEIRRFLEISTDLASRDRYRFEQFLDINRPRNLQELCRFAIRRTVSTSLLSGIRSLPVAKGIKKFLAFGLDLNIHDPMKTFELTIAIKERNIQQIKQLISGGIDLNFSISRHTPLTEAALTGDSVTCALLLENGADVDWYDDTGMTALHLASSNGNQSIVELLLQYGANVNKSCQFEVENSVTLAAANEHFRTMIYLIENGGDSSVPTCDGRQAIHLAAASGNVEAIKTLIEHNISTETHDYDRNTALHIAASRGLLYRNASYNFRENSDSNSVHCVYQDSVRFLLNAGASKLATNRYNKTPADTAIYFSNYEIALMLK